MRRVTHFNLSSKTGTTTTASTGPGQRPEQGELFAVYRHHCVFTDRALTLVQAKKHHRDHAVIELVYADLRSGPLAHLPSGSCSADGAWMILATIAFNLTRAAGCLASTFHAKATTGMIPAQLINVPAPARLLRPTPTTAPARAVALGARLDPADQST